MRRKDVRFNLYDSTSISCQLASFNENGSFPPEMFIQESKSLSFDFPPAIFHKITSICSEVNLPGLRLSAELSQMDQPRFRLAGGGLRVGKLRELEHLGGSMAMEVPP